MNEIILEAKDLCKSFSNASIQQHVLKNLNLKIHEDDFTIIMGSSGSGKSTLLYALSGIDRPSLGKVYIMGEDITNYSNDSLAIFRRRYCGFVFQQNYLNDTMSILDNILVCGLLVNRRRKNLVNEVEALIERVGLTKDILKKFPNQLSGGEQQRIAVVRAIINKPRILFADEPTGALNSKMAENVLDVLTELNKQGQSIIVVTHDIKTALRGNRILYLKDGIILDELKIGMYEENTPERHTKLHTFLTNMGW